LAVGQTLSTSTGSWSGSPTGYAYQWQYSRDQGASWLNVTGATLSTFREDSTFQGTLVRARVTATNAAGSTTAASAAAGPIAATSTTSVPVDTALPQVSGSLAVGQTLSTSTGSWSGSPTGYAYQWQYSRDQGASWLNVNGATLSTFREDSTFEGALVRARVTATNSAGSATAASAAAGPIAAATPLVVTTNLLSGMTLRKPVEWTATPNLPVSVVEFWIDGTLRWRSTSAPYAYNGADGVLDPNVLGAGSHTLTVKAIDASGRTATTAVMVFVPAHFDNGRVTYSRSTGLML
jgi:hypothetical protein